MALSIGIVGLPNIGKSTLFNALTNSSVQAVNYPFCTIEPNVGIVDVPDKRLLELTRLVKPRRTIPTQCKFMDIAGLVKGANKGEGLGNKFLAHIREAYAIVHLVRCFEDEAITHVNNRIDPLSDIEVINLELVLADLEIVERRLEKLARQKKSGDKAAFLEDEVLTRIKHALDAGQSIRTLKLNDQEKLLVDHLNLLTSKNVLYVANVSEQAWSASDDNEYVLKIRQLAAAEGAEVLVISARLEAELTLLAEEERQLFMEELGVVETGLDRLIAASYKMLNLATYFTAGEPEVRAWTIKQGTKAPQAAAVIHTDMERGFIRAEVISYAHFCACGSFHLAREQGLIRLEGKEYVVMDGDIMHFRFAV